jgi:hypothetical protein
MIPGEQLSLVVPHRKLVSLVYDKGTSTAKENKVGGWDIL